MKNLHRGVIVKGVWKRYFWRDVEDTINNGEIIEEYFDDKPYPSFLALKFYDKPLHVVFTKNQENNKGYVHVKNWIV